METACFLAAQDGSMIGEDYQVFLPDGGACGPVLVWGYNEPMAGGKQGESHTLQNLSYGSGNTFCNCSKVCVTSQLQLWADPEIETETGSGRLVAFVFVPSSGLVDLALCSIYLKQTTGKLCCRS